MPPRPRSRTPFPGQKASRAFTLVEVVLAVGVLSVAILSLIGLFAPTISAIKEVTDTDESGQVRSIVDYMMLTTPSTTTGSSTPQQWINVGMPWDKAVECSTGKAYFLWIEQPIESGKLGVPSFRFSASQPTSDDIDLLAGPIYCMVFQPDDSYPYLASDPSVYLNVVVLQLDPDALAQFAYTSGKLDFATGSYGFTETDIVARFQTLKRR